VSVVISGFRRCVNEIWSLLGCYAAQIGSLLSTFGDNLLVPSSRVKQAKKNLFGLFSSWIVWHLKMGLTGCPETPVRNYQFTLGKIPDKRRYQSISHLQLNNY